jgi:hypothetical protein
VVDDAVAAMARDSGAVLDQPLIEGGREGILQAAARRAALSVVHHMVTCVAGHP